MAKTILITGASRGLGRIWAEAFLKEGNKVAATARNPETLEELKREYGEAFLPVQLNVNDRNACFEAVEKVKHEFGTIDVVINNAGSGLFGTIEETTEQEARDQFETNVFGLLWVTQAVLPILREQKSGHIIQVSSLLGVITFPLLGVYNACKFAVEGLGETLAEEVKDFGIHVTLVEPNGFTTDWGGASAFHTRHMEVYQGVRDNFYKDQADNSYGDPKATAAAILKLVDTSNPPLRLFLGKEAFPRTKRVYADRLKTWEEWSDVANAAHGF